MAKKKKAKSRVTIEITDRKLMNVDAPINDALIDTHLAKVSKDSGKVANALLISRLNHPEYVKYDNEILVVSPRAKLKIDKNLLQGKLPDGVLVKLVK